MPTTFVHGMSKSGVSLVAYWIADNCAGPYILANYNGSHGKPSPDVIKRFMERDHLIFMTHDLTAQDAIAWEQELAGYGMVKKPVVSLHMLRDPYNLAATLRNAKESLNVGEWREHAAHFHRLLRLGYTSGRHPVSFNDFVMDISYRDALIRLLGSTGNALENSLGVGTVWRPPGSQAMLEGHQVPGRELKVHRRFKSINPNEMPYNLSECDDLAQTLFPGVFMAWKEYEAEWQHKEI